VRENRISGLVIHIMIAASIFLLAYVEYVPMAVLFGLFLYMGINSLSGNQFFDRIMLWVTDPKLYPNTHYTRLVPHKVIHTFTIIQFICFVALWVLKSSSIGILFPLLIAALVPIRLFVSKYFEKEHIEALIAEEEGHDEGEKRHVLD
ncbi:MAG TPA: hypothetical protein VKZ68_07695, partial [Ohtaekwangia sp.]|nr:hypothetical protein [Ohtaekwangia sp.]